MNKGIQCTMIAALVWLLTYGIHITLAADDAIEIKVSDPVSYARVYSDSEGNSHYADEEVTFELLDYAPPAPPISVSEAIKADKVSFISSPSGWFGDWHPAPRRQFVIILVGEVEVEVSDGEKRRFGPGSFALLEDTSGVGHVSRIVSSERCLVMAIPLAEK